MNPTQALHHYSQILSKQTKFTNTEAVFFVKQIIAHLQQSPWYKLMWPDAPALQTQQLEALKTKIKQMAQGHPLQYVIGTASFCGLDFAVGPGVLIPRPETEELTTLALSFLKNKLNPVVIDACTGSGCIPITIKTKMPSTNVHAFDVSPAALAFAHQNAATHKANINIFKADLYHLVQANTLPAADLITANPPYVPMAEYNTLDPTVKNHEPETALQVPDNNPLVFYELLLQVATKILQPNGLLIMETHYQTGLHIPQLSEKYGFTTTLKTDFNGKLRFAWCQRQPTY